MNRVLQLRAQAAYVLGLARDAEQNGDVESTDALLTHVAALELEAASVLERATATQRGQ